MQGRSNKNDEETTAYDEWRQTMERPNVMKYLHYKIWMTYSSNNRIISMIRWFLLRPDGERIVGRSIIV